MCAGCRMHSHARGLVDYSLSSGESEIMAMSELLKEAKRLGQMIFNQSFKAQSKLESNNSFNRTWKMNFLKMHEQLEKAYKDMNAEDLVKLPEKKILEKIQTLAKAVGGQKDNLKQLK